MASSTPDRPRTAPWIDEHPEEHSVLLVANETLRGDEAIEEIRGDGDEPLRVYVVAPVRIESRLDENAGLVDDDIGEARRRLSDTVTELNVHGITATGAVGDADPMLAIRDAIAHFPADEVVITSPPSAREHRTDAPLLEHAGEEIGLPVTHVVIDGGTADVTHVEAEGETPGARAEEKRRSARDIAAIVLAIGGTLILWILAGAGIHGDVSGEESVRWLIAAGAFVISVWHVVGLMFFEATRYRGRLATITADLILFGMPPALALSAVLALT